MMPNFLQVFDQAAVIAQTTVLAQATSSSSSSWLDAIDRMDMGKLVIVLSLGIGFVTIIGYTLTELYKVAQGVPANSAALEARIEELESRLAQLESQSSRAA